MNRFVTTMISKGYQTTTSSLISVRRHVPCTKSFNQFFHLLHLNTHLHSVTSKQEDLVTTTFQNFDSHFSATRLEVPWQLFSRFMYQIYSDSFHIVLTSSKWSKLLSSSSKEITTHLVSSPISVRAQNESDVISIIRDVTIQTETSIWASHTHHAVILPLAV